MTTFTESFNKADSTTLGPDLTWTELGGDYQVISNAANVTTAAVRHLARAEHDTGSADMFAEVVVSGLGSANYNDAAAVVRMSADGQSGYQLRRGYATANGAFWDVVRFSGGADTSIAGRTSLAYALPETWRLEVQGSTLRAYLGGTLMGTWTDTAIASGSFAGIAGYRSTTSSRLSVIDSFSTGSLAATPVSGTLAGTTPALTGALTGTSAAPPPADAFSTHFDGASLPAGWSFSSALGDGSVAVASSRATITCPAATHDSIFNTSVADNSVGVAAPIPDHGGDIDIAVQIDSDLTDKLGQGVNLLATNAAGDAVRFCIYLPDTADDEYPSIYAYSRAGGVGASPVNDTYSRYMTGCPAWLRIKYTAATGVWAFLTSSDGVTWVGDWSRSTSTGDLTITRAFTADTFKVGVTNVAATMTAATLAVQRAVDLIATATTDLREAVPSRVATTIATLDGTAGALAAPWTNDCAGTDTLTWTGTALRLNHDPTQDASTGARAAIGYTGTRHPEWGILAKLAQAHGNTNCYITISGSTGTGTRDQYHIGGGYGLEIQSGPIRRPIRIDDNTDATNTPVAPYPTDLNETPYCHLKSWPSEYDMTLHGVRWFRLERIGGRYRVKEWADGSAEPSTWNLLDAQDQVIGDDLGPYLAYSHNGVRTGTTTDVDVYSLEFYSLTAAATPSGALDGQTPALTAALTATATATAALEVTLPALTAAVDATTTVSGDLTGALPALAGDLTGSVTATATLAGTLAGPTAALTGTVGDVTTGTLAATLPALTGDLTAHLAVTAGLAATLPALTSDLVLQVTNRATIAGTLPALMAALSGTSGASVVNGTPVRNPTLTLTTPASTLTLTTPPSTLELT